jgi:hypothetical protein
MEFGNRQMLCPAVTNRFGRWGIDDSFDVGLLFETLLSLPDYSLGIYS